MLEMCFNCDYCEEQNGDYFCTNNESEYVGDYVEKDFDRTEFRTSYECISATFDGRTFAIGKYATPERAAEVFMDMHKAYAPVQVVCTNMDEKQVYALVAASQNAPIRCVEVDDPRMAVTVFDNLVYYMPEK